MSLFIFSIVFLCLCRNTVPGYIEYVQTSACHNCKIYLTCRHFNAVIAVLKVNFLTNTTEQITPIYIRQELNRRCSGVNHCSFVLVEDCPDAVLWGEGTLDVNYACISDDKISTFCNTRLVLDNRTNEGFIHNPGYPRFYSSQRECRWKLMAAPEQRIQITLMDISIIMEKPQNDGCGDRLQIYDDGQMVETLCHQQEPLFVWTSDTPLVDVVLSSLHSLVPMRGVLFYYKVIGCATLVAPIDGYLVYRNETVAEYRCCVGFTFADDSGRNKLLYCKNSVWNAQLPECHKTDTRLVPTETIIRRSQMASDLLAPALLILALFVINFIVLFYIYKIKQKQANEYTDEELGTLPITSKERPSS